MCRSSEGLAVAEVDLDAADMSEREVIEEARRRGAALVWAYSDQEPETFGFVSRPGYARLHADTPLTGPALPLVAPDEYGSLLAEAYRGLWGHKWVDEREAVPTHDSIVICLSEAARPIGLCRIWPKARLIDQPGVVPAHRGTAPALTLLSAACARMGPGPVDVDTWGESPDVLHSYTARLGFEVLEERPGWELLLQPAIRSARAMHPSPDGKR